MYWVIERSGSKDGNRGRPGTKEIGDLRQSSTDGIARAKSADSASEDNAEIAECYCDKHVRTIISPWHARDQSTVAHPAHPFVLASGAASRGDEKVVKVSCAFGAAPSMTPVNLYTSVSTLFCKSKVQFHA